MICKNCEKFALFPQVHGCVNCARFVNYREMKWCNYCSTLKNICSICGKLIKNDTISQDLSDQIKTIHPFYNSGCKTCGGGRKH